MELWDLPVRDLRPMVTELRQDLTAFLTRLSADEWVAPSAAPGWSVKDLALHLLDDELWWLSHERDRDTTGLVDMTDRDQFVRLLAAKNQRFIDGAQGLSPRVVVDLLAWSGDQVDAYHSTQNLRGDGWVSWASDGPVPYWFNIAQEFTERWVHQMQMREAVDRVDDHLSYLPEVLRTFVWALPHQFRAPVEVGAQVQVDLACGGVWHLTSAGSGSWSLTEGTSHAPKASLVFPDDAGWRWLTGATTPGPGVELVGQSELLEPLLRTRSIIV